MMKIMEISLDIKKCLFFPNQRYIDIVNTHTHTYISRLEWNKWFEVFGRLVILCVWRLEQTSYKCWTALNGISFDFDASFSIIHHTLPYAGTASFSMFYRQDLWLILFSLSFLSLTCSFVVLWIVDVTPNFTYRLIKLTKRKFSINNSFTFYFVCAATEVVEVVRYSRICFNSIQWWLR